MTPRDKAHHRGEPQSRPPWRVAAAIAVALALAGLAFAIPATIGSGLDQLPPERRDAGAEALTLASMGCRENPAQRVLAPALKLRWLSPAWDSAAELSPGWDPAAQPSQGPHPAVVARLRTFTVFGLPAGDITIFGNGAIVCRAVGLERE